ncbi:MAG: ABC transporter ATP-binding protein [Patescibacteria group bacterium]
MNEVTTSPTTPIISIEDVHKSFQVGIQDIQILKGVDVKINYGDFAVIIGPSGCGKSTLLHILLGLEPPTKGIVKFLGSDLYAGTNEDTRSDFRKKHIGMVYQQANWIKSLTVIENVSFPLLLLGIGKPKAMAKAYEMLKKVNMQDWGDYIPTELSGGQQQRVALARALINNPEIIIADEPTGNLDYEAGQNIMTLLTNLNNEFGKTVIMVTHDLEYISYAKTTVRLLDGKVLGIYNEGQKDKLMEELKFKRLGDMKAKLQESENITPAPATN